MSKSKTQLESELADVSAKLEATMEELQSIKTDAVKAVRSKKAALQKEAEGFKEKNRQLIEDAKAEYTEIRYKAKAIMRNLENQETSILGIPGIAARDAQIQTLKEIFGDL
jgi:chromosome segregation ATPase